MSWVYLLCTPRTLGWLLRTRHGRLLRSVGRLKRARPEPRFRYGFGALVRAAAAVSGGCSAGPGSWKFGFLLMKVRSSVAGAACPCCHQK